MRLSIIAILLSISAICYGQQDTIKLDTIDLNAQSKMIVKQITEQLQQIEETKRELEEKLIILLTGAGIDPKKVAGFTQDFKTLSRK